MQETWVGSLDWREPLEEGMATHSSILAWRIPRTEEPGGLQSLGSQRVKHDWGTMHSFAAIHLSLSVIQKKKKIERLQNIFSYSLQCFWFCSCFLRFLFLSGKALSEIFPVLCVQSHNHVQLFTVPWTIACQASPSTKSRWLFTTSTTWEDQNFLLFFVQSLSHVRLFATPRTAAHQASLSFTISRSLLKRMSIELMMSSNHLILCHPLLLLPLIFPSIRVFSNELAFYIMWPKYWNFSEYSGLTSFRIDWFDLFASQGTLNSLLQHHNVKALILGCSA